MASNSVLDLGLLVLWFYSRLCLFLLLSDTPNITAVVRPGGSPLFLGFLSVGIEFGDRVRRLVWCSTYDGPDENRPGSDHG